MSDSVRSIFKRIASDKKKKTNEPPLVGVDVDLGLYELTDLFHAFYKYHNVDYLVNYDEVVGLEGRKIKTQVKSLSRFQALRRIEAARLGSRPFLGGKGVARHKPNVSLGYMRMLMDYLELPYKSLFTDSGVVKVRIDKKHHTLDKLPEKDREAFELQARNNPNLISNAEVSDDASDAFSNVMKRSNKVQAGFDRLPRRLAQDGVMSFLHSDLDWTPEPIDALDLVTEPQADWNPCNWSTFFIIRKMTAQEAVSHIRKPGRFWNPSALAWALESSGDGKGLLSYNHYNGYMDDETDKICGENFSVKSFYTDKSTRRTNIGSYYGNMLVVEAYYQNINGKINKAIFFPSEEFLHVAHKDRVKSISAPMVKTKAEVNELEYADILFHRQNVFNSMEEAITVIPFDRSEPSLERQRAYGHELFSPLEVVMRMDSSILNLATMMGVPFTKNNNQGTDSQDMEDLEIDLTGEIQDIGDRDFAQVPFRGDLNAMLAVRTALLQHAASKAYLGGLDGQEQVSSGRGANLANLRLIRDGRVHKHTVEDMAKGLRSLFIRMFKRILDLKSKTGLSDDVLLQKTFFEVLVDLQGHDESLFDYDPEDIVPDSGLPYWIEIEAIRNGASHFGAAELILYSEIKQVFGDGLDQQGLQNLNRMGIKSLLGQQDALDILGDPKDNIVTEQDQIYRASLENASLLGSVDSGALNFEPVLVLNDKDDHVAHLTQVHLPKASEIIQRLENSEVSPQELQEYSESELETRNSLILKLGAIANHVSLHQQNLERFGSSRDDINRLKEETNNIMQSAEGLMNSLQISLRALVQKRQETEARLMNMSPENEAERMKQEMELIKVRAQQEQAKDKLTLANKLADQRQQQHVDKQLSKARDRRLKASMAQRDAELREQEIQQSTQLALLAKQTESNGSSDKSNE